jgi:hypothetical protein
MTLSNFFLSGQTRPDKGALANKLELFEERKINANSE